MTFLFGLLILFQIKHWLCDFVWQTTAEIQHKGTYGNSLGMMHSVKHSVGTAVALLLMGTELQWAWPLAVLDGVLHYHIDWAKMNWGCQDQQDAKFWNHLGLDQMSHQLTYIGIVAILVA